MHHNQALQRCCQAASMHADLHMPMRTGFIKKHSGVAAYAAITALPCIAHSHFTQLHSVAARLPRLP